MDKIKVYLDTNTVHDFFVNQAVALKRKEEPKVPEKLKFFLEIREKVEFVTSVATKAEVSRELIAGYALTSEQFEILWNGFIEKLKCRYLEEFSLDKRFGEYPQKIKMKLRTLVNFIHLFIAVKEDAYIVSGDKDLIDKVRENKIYGKILSYVEFRKLIASLYGHA